MSERCMVCGLSVAMVTGEGDGVVCTYHCPDFLIEHLGGHELNEWGKQKLVWAMAVKSGKIGLLDSLP